MKVNDHMVPRMTASGLDACQGVGCSGCPRLCEKTGRAPMSQLLPSASEPAAHALVEPGFAAWQQGYGPVEHSPETRAAVFRMAHQLVQAGQQPDLASV